MTPSSILILLVDAALRSLLVAAVVGLGLAVLRTRNVVAQKAAWMLVLAAATLMPWAARWAAHLPWLPQSAQFVLPAMGLPHPGSAWMGSSAAPNPSSASVGSVSSDQGAFRVPHPSSAGVGSSSSSDTVSPASSLRVQPTHDAEQTQAAAPQSNEGRGSRRFPAPSIATDSVSSHATLTPAPQAAPHSLHLNAAWIVLLAYLAGCGVFLFRLLYGVWAATWLWADAKPVWLSGELDTDGLRLRSSERIASPITVGSGIVLPADFASWDAEKLRIVLAHESSHVRQGDFYLQIGASLYAALFWFSPLGWWLKRKLSDLSETISDGAAVECAASHASYAQVLLEFAAQPRQIPIGVAMAHHGRLIPRIERLLNESSFRQAFAGGRARIAAAVLLVPAALFAATAMVRVEAAQQPPQPAAAPQAIPAQAPDALSGVAAPPAADAITVSPQAPAAPAAPPTDGTPALAPVAPNDSLAPVAPAMAPAAPSDDAVISMGRGSYTLTIPNRRAMAKQAQAMALLAARDGRMMAMRGRGDGHGFGYGYGFGDDGNSYAYVTGSGEKSTHFSGNWYEASKAEIEKARKVAHGDFIWFERDGKSYVIDDPAALAGLKPMQDKMEALGAQQEELGKQQEALGEKQEELGKQQELASVPTPDVSKELAQLTETIKKLDAQKGGTVTMDQLGELESKIGDLQGKIGEIQGKIGEKQGALGEKQGELGEQQGKLGEQQGRLGEEQGRIAREMDGKVLTMIDEYLKNGKAKQVQ